MEEENATKVVVNDGDLDLVMEKLNSMDHRALNRGTPSRALKSRRPIRARYRISVRESGYSFSPCHLLAARRTANVVLSLASNSAEKVTQLRISLRPVVATNHG